MLAGKQIIPCDNFRAHCSQGRGKTASDNASAKGETIDVLKKKALLLLIKSSPVIYPVCHQVDVDSGLFQSLAKN